MIYELIGYVDTEDHLDNYLSVEIPVFRNEDCDYVQVIDDHNYHVVAFRDVTTIKYIEYAGETNLAIGENALYIFRFNDEVFLGDKASTDAYVATKINTQNLTKLNLFSLYSFLGLREKVLEVVKEIADDPDMKLNANNFIIPDARPINIDKKLRDIRIKSNILSQSDQLPSIIKRPDKIIDYPIVISEEAISESIAKYYSNVFFSLVSIDFEYLVGGMIHGFVPGSFTAIKLGFNILTRKFLVDRLVQFTIKQPTNHFEYKMNDFLLGLVLYLENRLPEKVRFWHYLTQEIVTSDTITNHLINPDVRSVQIFSSTNYYLLYPDEKIADETFAFRSIRVEKDVAAHPIEVSEDVIDLDDQNETYEIIYHIKSSNMKLISPTTINHVAPDEQI
jgi:hypothetical protein